MTLSRKGGGIRFRLKDVRTSTKVLLPSLAGSPNKAGEQVTGVEGKRNPLEEV